MTTAGPSSVSKDNKDNKDNNNNNEHNEETPIRTFRTSSQEAGHTIQLTPQGLPYSHCHNRRTCTNELGELGRRGDPYVSLPIFFGPNYDYYNHREEIISLGQGENNENDENDTSTSSSISPKNQINPKLRAVQAYVGGFPSSGHSALLDEHGHIWFSGCDRWQQLGLGSSNAGSSGYTWKGGRLWQDQFQRNDHVVDLIRKLDPSLGGEGSDGGNKYNARRWVRDVAIGGDHTVILSSNKKEVIVFGKGGEGQLGLSSKPWVSAPARSKALSSLSSSSPEIAAVCAFRNCSFTLGEDGGVIKSVGKNCSVDLGKGIRRALENCRRRGRESGLIKNTAKLKK